MNRTSFVNAQIAERQRRRGTTRRTYISAAAALSMSDALATRRTQRGMRGIINLAENRCEWGGLEVACNLIREYDGQTGANHFEYAMPEETGNVNIWRVNADNSLKFVNKQPGYEETPKPTLPYLNTATTTDDPVFFNGMPVIRPAEPPATPPPTRPTTPTPAVLPPQQPPAPAPRRYEDAAPPGTFTYGAGRRYTSDFTPQTIRTGRGGGSSLTITTTTTGGGAGAGTGTGGSGAAGGAGGGTGSGGSGGAGGSTGGGSGTGTGGQDIDQVASPTSSGGGLFEWAGDLFSEDGQVLDAIKKVPTWAWLGAGAAAVAMAASQRR